ncbi:MAG: NAD(+) synthase [Lentisphaeria bacterium]|nr:NAD(+) synthase [Lentisphaeria bacterium]MDY0175762.1 NAD(+) synthase [Lentisphaeria bacterium]
MSKTYRIAVGTPVLQVANPHYNAERIIQLYERALLAGAAVLALPELCLSSYSCADLFSQPGLHEAVQMALLRICQASKGQSCIMLLGLPFCYAEQVFNAAAVIQDGELRALVGKQQLINHREFNEQRHFSPAADWRGEKLLWQGRELPFADKLLLRCGSDFCFGIEFGSDLLSLQPPSAQLALNGADLVFNLAAEPEMVGKASFRRSLVKTQSARIAGVYVYAGAGVGESSSDLLFSGHALIAENGRLLAENQRFQREDSLLFADLKPAWSLATRRAWTSFKALARESLPLCQLESPPESPDWRYFNMLKLPFVPEAEEDLRERCQEIFNIQAAALAKRLEHISCRRLILGLSGGLDSTLALLVCLRCCDLLGLPRNSILALCMPGFGTGEQSRQLAQNLAALAGVEFRQIDIRPAVSRHFADIQHDPEKQDLVYENSQARERTQILMDLANAENGLVIGTGNLSEIALGWNTFNADHMSMYNVNCAVPKTLVRFLVENQAKEESGEMGELLRQINAAPVSPELLPGKQHTESILGSFKLHDFYLYHFLKYGEKPEDLKKMALHAFAGEFDEKEVERTVKLFFQRFFSQQFKRNAMPDGPKVGTISLSSRADWQMPADASAEAWL